MCLGFAHKGSKLEILFIFIGIFFAAYATAQFIKSSTDSKRSFISKLWEWVKNVFDALTNF